MLKWVGWSDGEALREGLATIEKCLKQNFDVQQMTLAQLKELTQIADALLAALNVIGGDTSYLAFVKSLEERRAGRKVEIPSKV